MRRARIALLFSVTTLQAGVACDPIVGTPPEAIPVNACPENACLSPSSCSAGRCQVQGNPSYDYVLMVDVPTTSFYAAGTSFLIRNKDLQTKVSGCIVPRTCFQLPSLATVNTTYSVTTEAATALGVDPSAVTVVPHVTFIPLSPVTTDGRLASNIGLPTLDVTTSIANDSPPYALTFLAPGNYTRVAVSPQDALPPILTPQSLLANTAYADAIEVRQSGETCPPAPAPCYALDETPTNPRLLQSSRQGGLDGYRAWLADGATNIRVSSLRTLSGASASVHLSTVGQNDPSNLLPTLRNVNEILAPPEGAVAVPTLVSQTNNGSISDLRFPALPPPASIQGQVTDATNAGVSATLVFDNDPGGVGLGLGITLVAPDGADHSLTYRTSVATDNAGRYATVLPPGSYAVTVIPNPASGQGLLIGSDVTISGDGSLAPFVVSAKSGVSGVVELADGRPLAGADVRATASVSQASNPGVVPRTSPWVFPRETHATTAPDGSFVLFADVGTYDLTFSPQPGTGFPRLVSRGFQVAPAANAQDVPAIGTFKVPAPVALEYTVYDPQKPQPNPIPSAILRVFSSYPATDGSGGLDYVEIGEGMTDANGNCEILLSPFAP